MDNYKKLRPVAKQLKYFLDAGFNGKFETWYSFELDWKDSSLIEDAMRKASETRERCGDENYFYVVGYIKACIENSFWDKNLDTDNRVLTSKLELAEHHLSLLYSALIEYKSYCDELEKPKISLLLNILNDIKPDYMA